MIERRSGPAVIAWLATLALLAAACQETVTAPGACPNFCPPAQLEVFDTVVTGVVEREEWGRGFILPQRVVTMQIVADPAGRSSVGVVQFFPFSDSIASGTGFIPVQSVDSFKLELEQFRLSATGDSLVLVVHRLPIGLDSSTSYNDVVPFIDDSTEVATIALIDTVGNPSVVIPVAAFPAYVTDSFVPIPAGSQTLRRRNRRWPSARSCDVTSRPTRPARVSCSKTRGRERSTPS
jgi:hypothetical protein